MFQFVAYLWGIETWSVGWSVLGTIQFVAYLWGIETTWTRRWPPFSTTVCSLPMRNWNRLPSIIRRKDRSRVCSLPMRNWNNRARGKLQRAKPFVAYLWGIETLTIPDFSSSAANVCSLPMRNWNIPTVRLRKTGMTFVAYLWGIETAEEFIMDWCKRRGTDHCVWAQ